ncbi:MULTISPECIES: AAA family ATPase [unclassified Coleofasciculus]|uniref:AAA family ATPase n=1 Tax=unclassified Coleofasciculus TaxID=2692782 RepID=UPI001880A9DE|nr:MULTISPECIES: AAA family ATPase [unclassified Coleofasciculus]MBE9125102.1 AAA family ATPase [Coleofasciculus sp. LEGE 07081]MBE9150105.1 AAA family ATPase [Coleofasciculus sp. LEGE 07092]
MEGKRLIRTLRLKNLLSYGSEGEEIELQPLNVLIGRNTSGKSNLIEAVGLLRATPKDLTAAIRKGGGISELLWKSEESPIAEIEAIIGYPEGNMPLRYRLNFTEVNQKLEIIDEVVENYDPANQDAEEVDFFYRYQQGNPIIKIKGQGLMPMKSNSFVANQSIIYQIRAPQQHPEITYLSNKLKNICIYDEWYIGSNSKLKKPQNAYLPAHPLLEDGSNIGLVFNNLQYQLGSKTIIDNLKKFYEEVEELTVRIYSGTVQIFIREEGLIQPIPINRLSDGTLRYLFLLALLLDPTPPPLICIEEPEIGLHPDILPTIAELLIEASQRTQLIVTTHSDALVSALPPESVLVCERDEKGSHLKRLNPEDLKEWLEDFSLGHLWRMGEIGGTRW